MLFSRTSSWLCLLWFMTTRLKKKKKEEKLYRFHLQLRNLPFPPLWHRRWQNKNAGSTRYAAEMIDWSQMRICQSKKYFLEDMRIIPNILTYYTIHSNLWKILSQAQKEFLLSDSSAFSLYKGMVWLKQTLESNSQTHLSFVGGAVILSSEAIPLMERKWCQDLLF